MKISLKLALLVGAVSIFSGLLSMVAAAYVIQRIVISRVQNQLESISTIKENQLSQSIRNLRDLLSILANEREVVMNVSDSGKPLNKNELTEIFNEHVFPSFFSEYFLIDKNGLIVLSTTPNNEGKIVADEQYFLSARSGSEYAQSFYYDPVIAGPSITISYPVLDLTGSVKGVLAGRANVGAISKIMEERAGLGKSGETFLVNQYNLAVSKVRFLNKEGLGENIYSPGINECLKGDSGFHDIGADGTSIIGSHIWLPDYQVCLVSRLNRSEALEPAYRAIPSLLAIGLVAALFTALIGFLLSKKISIPMKDLASAARAISGGNLNIKLNIKGEDELADLGAAFNEMSQKLAIKDRAIKEEEARLRASINSLRIGFLIADHNDRILVQNSAITNILSLSEKFSGITKIEEELSGLLDLRANIKRCLQTNEIVEVRDLPFRNKFLKIVVAPVSEGEKKDVIGYILLIEDVTGSKLLERTKDEFFAVASHELRTPLTAIRGNMSLIKEFFFPKLKDKELKEMIDDSYTASVRLITIVNDFLDISRLEQGKIQFQNTNFDVATVIQEVVHEVENVAIKKGLTLSLKADTDIPNVFGDKEKIKQIISNLIGNAINYTGSGSITVEISKDGDHVKTRVSDTGIGISSQNQGLLFQKFQSAGERVLARDVTKGTGLGLYISKLLAEGMNGSIELERSELGKGSVFSLKLPIAK